MIKITLKSFSKLGEMQIISGIGVKNVLTFVETGCIDSQFDCLVKTPINVK